MFYTLIDTLATIKSWRIYEVFSRCESQEYSLYFTAIAEYSPHFLVLSKDYPTPPLCSVNKTCLKSRSCALTMDCILQLRHIFIKKILPYALLVTDTESTILYQNYSIRHHVVYLKTFY